MTRTMKALARIDELEAEVDRLQRRNDDLEAMLKDAEAEVAALGDEVYRIRWQPAGKDAGGPP